MVSVDLGVRVETRADVAVGTVLVLAAAITTVPVAPAVVVLVVAEVVAGVCRRGTAFVARCVAVSNVQALAFRAVVVGVVRPAAISAVPVAFAVVVGVVAIAITFPLWMLARRGVFVRSAVVVRRQGRVQAQTVRAVNLQDGSAAAITPVPITELIVVLVVAEAVRDQVRRTRQQGALYRLSSRRRRSSHVADVSGRAHKRRRGRHVFEGRGACELIVAVCGRKHALRCRGSGGRTQHLIISCCCGVERGGVVAGTAVTSALKVKLQLRARHPLLWQPASTKKESARSVCFGTVARK